MEMLLALLIGMAVIASATDLAVGIWKGRRGWTVREKVDRDARYLGLSLQQDASMAGIGLESSATFASLATGGDTLSILRVARMYFPPAPDSTEAPVYPLHNDGGSGSTYPLGVGNCGATCLEFADGVPRHVQVGDLVQLRAGPVRRLLLVTGVANTTPPRFQITFLNVTRLAGRPSGLAGVALPRSGTTMQQVDAVQYYRDAGTNQLLRAERFNTQSGAPLGDAVATDVTGFEARLRFRSGAELPNYDGTDADSTNDGNQIMGASVRAELQAARTDTVVNGGRRIKRWYRWRITPRNLLYEKNR
jgi:hypothetical protein